MRSQDSAPLLQALQFYQEESPLRLHMPGHKGRDFAPLDIPATDVTEVPGLDDLHDPTGPIAAAQGLCANLYGARATHFLVGGSTAGLLALMLATTGEGQRVLVPRHAHRSILTGLVLSGARPIWLEPLYDPAADLVIGVPAAHYAEAMRRVGGVTAFWGISPSYQGVAPDLTGAAALARTYGLPLLVDEAHGAHFPFDQRLPRPALGQGATAVVQSAHKTLTALTQAAWLHVGSGPLDQERLRAALRMVQSSSPSYVLLASLDAARRHMAGAGRNGLAEAISAAEWARSQLRLTGGPLLPASPEAVENLAHRTDPTKLWLDVTGLGLTGPEAAQALREQGLQVEMAGPRHVLLMFTLADGRQSAERALQILTALQSGPRTRERRGAPPHGSPPRGDGPEAAAALWLQRPLTVWPEAGLSPREATFRAHRRAPLAEAVGMVAAESLVPYPPGIPLVMPGERLTPDLLDFVRSVRAAGVRFQGAADPTLAEILIVS